MENLLVKDFAAVLGVTDRAIYKQIERHRDELEGKIVKKPKQTWLTPEAQDIIRSYTVQPPTVVLESETLAELQQLRQENHDLQGKLAAELERSRTTALKIAELSKSAGLLEAAQQRENELRKQRDKDREAYIEARGRLESAKSEAERKLATAEAERNAAIESRNEARTDLENSTKLNRWLTAAVPAAVAIGAVLCMAIIKIIGG